MYSISRRPHEKTSPPNGNNVDVLIKWLSVIGRKDLTKIVEDYKLKSLHQSTLPNSKAAKVVSPGASECLQENAEQADPNSQSNRLSQELVLLGGEMTMCVCVCMRISLTFVL